MLLYFSSLCQGLGTETRTVPATRTTSIASGFRDLSAAEDINTWLWWLWVLQSIFCYWSFKTKTCQIFPNASWSFLSLFPMLHNRSRNLLVLVNSLKTGSPCKNCWISWADFRVASFGGIKCDPKLIFSRDRKLKAGSCLHYMITNWSSWYPSSILQKTKIFLEGSLSPAGLVSGLGCMGGLISLSELNVFLPSIIGPEFADFCNDLYECGC